jgi:hypothetical protein
MVRQIPEIIRDDRRLPTFPRRSPDSDVETLEMFAGRIAQFNDTREDVKTWFDLLDLDDHITFGGKA